MASIYHIYAHHVKLLLVGLRFVRFVLGLM